MQSLLRMFSSNNAKEEDPPAPAEVPAVVTQSDTKNDKKAKNSRHKSPRVRSANSDKSKTATSNLRGVLRSKNNASNSPYGKKSATGGRQTLAVGGAKGKARAASNTNVKYSINQVDINKLLKQNTRELMSSLTPEVKQAFEILYTKLDINESGTINAKEIQNLILKQTEKQLTAGELADLLAELDLKGTGDIEFDEFIYMLSQPENYVRLLDQDDLKKIQNDITDMTLKHRLKELEKKHFGRNSGGTGCELEPADYFFLALRKVTQQNNMDILKRFYENRLKKLNDHVIHDWSAGQRCIGLSDQEMVKRFEGIQGDLLRQKVNFCKDNSYKSSPYAKPLEWGLLTLREGIEERREIRRLEVLEARNRPAQEKRAKISDFQSTPKAVPLPKYVVGRRHPLKKTFDYDQLADIRQKVDRVAGTYYYDLKDVANENCKVIEKALQVDKIPRADARENFGYTFRAYSSPFVVSPWIPMPSPASLQSSYTPLGKSKFYIEKKW